MGHSEGDRGAMLRSSTKPCRAASVLRGKVLPRFSAFFRLRLPQDTAVSDKRTLEAAVKPKT